MARGLRRRFPIVESPLGPRGQWFSRAAGRSSWPETGARRPGLGHRSVPGLAVPPQGLGRRRWWRDGSPVEAALPRPPVGAALLDPVPDLGNPPSLFAPDSERGG